MMEIVHIDRTGRLALSTTLLRELGAKPGEDVMVELIDDGLLIRRKDTTAITDRIAAMNLPVADREQMESEIETGRLA